MKALQIFGLPRTCTNIVNVLLDKNMESVILINKPNWKHGKNTLPDRKVKYLENVMEVKKKTNRLRRLDEDNDYLYFVICVKDPYRWLVSFYKHLIKRKMYENLTFDKMLMLDSCYYYDLNVIDAYNEMLNHWLHLYNGKGLFVIKSEDLLQKTDQIQFLDRIHDKLDLKRKNSTYYTKTKEVLQGVLKNRINADRLVEYKQLSILPFYNDQIINEINSRFYEFVVIKSGYKLLSFEELREREFKTVPK